MGILDTARLRLREMFLDDLDFVSLMLSDPEVMRFYPKPCTREESEVWIGRNLARYAEDGHGLWLAIDKETDEPVGQVGLCHQEVDRAKELEIGYLIHRPFWRKGLATEAALATRDFAFDVLGKHRVISMIRTINEPLRRVAERIAMTPGKRIDWRGYEHIVYSLDVSKWSRI